MIRFNNDYNKPAHSKVLKAVMDISDVSYPGYGLDELCEKAKAEIKKYINKPEAEVHFLVGGTQKRTIMRMRTPVQLTAAAVMSAERDNTYNNH